MIWTFSLRPLQSGRFQMSNFTRFKFVNNRTSIVNDTRRVPLAFDFPREAFGKFLIASAYTALGLPGARQVPLSPGILIA